MSIFNLMLCESRSWVFSFLLNWYEPVITVHFLCVAIVWNVTSLSLSRICRFKRSWKLLTGVSTCLYDLSITLSWNLKNKSKQIFHYNYGINCVRNKFYNKGPWRAWKSLSNLLIRVSNCYLLSAIRGWQWRCRWRNRSRRPQTSWRGEALLTSWLRCHTGKK